MSGRSGFLRYIHWIPALLYAGLIFWLSNQSRVPSLMGRVPDEAGHGLGYLVFSLTLVAGATSSFRSRLTARTAWLLWLLAVLYGISDEFHQSFVPGRDPSLGDLLVDALGAGVGLLGCWLVWRPRRG